MLEAHTFPRPAWSCVLAHGLPCLKEPPYKRNLMYKDEVLRTQSDFPLKNERIF